MAEDSGESVDYLREVRPLLDAKCAACHGALKQSGGLRLDAGTLIRAGGDSGPVIVPGKSLESLLIDRVQGHGDAQMPPEGQGERLTPAQLNLLVRWINQGAVSPEDEPVPEDPASHWSYQPPVRPALPVPQESDWMRTPIDHFIAAGHEARRLKPSPPASPAVWLRRVCLDVTGLPPTQEELSRFLADPSDAAKQQVVDRLLDRPEYGERWGRHWMDVWRYSDWYGSRGINEIRYSQRHIWRWRDWIVDSLNRDKAYHRMIMEMLAGDEVAPADPDVLSATGFLGRNWYKFDRNVWMFDTVEHTSQAFLGLTMKCARCHDHKFDPITQQDYYRLRACFEPHDVRTEPTGGNGETEKDATLGPVLKEGLSRVFDKSPDAPTFLFERGDDRFPDESTVMIPAVPAAFGSQLSEIEQISLPPEAWYPSLRSQVIDGLLTAAQERTEVARKNLSDARDAVTSALTALQSREQSDSRLHSKTEDTGESESIADAPLLLDDFQHRADVWKVISGNWAWQEGKLVESSVGNFATLVADVVHPTDFEIHLKYRTLQAGNIRSVGFSFDYLDQGNSQDVYTSTRDESQSVQAFHRKDGQQSYPQAGIAQASLKVEEITTIEATVRGPRLTIRLNGEQKLDYVMPVPRREGRFAIWVHNGSAEFLEVSLRRLVPSVEELRENHLTAVANVGLKELQLYTARCEEDALTARIAAEREKHLVHESKRLTETALTASRAEKRVIAARAGEDLTAAQNHLNSLRRLQGQGHGPGVRTADRSATSESHASESAATTTEAIAEAEKSVEAAATRLKEAESAVDAADGTYEPLGPVWPNVSTGRRLALAEWIARADNPRTSRIAVNHIWLRHFGEALVPTVANFGLNGQRPSHPELLDWLAVELSENGWKMKHIHRLILLSATYGQQSYTDDGTPTTDLNRTIDPRNRFLWRMNSRRMEAEVVRDSVLFAAGVLNQTMGGPEISETETLRNHRRSLYFRNTPNEKSAFLDAFDPASPNECYRRSESVVPQQSLTLMNSSLTLEQSRRVAANLHAEQTRDTRDNDTRDNDSPELRREFVRKAFCTVLSRNPTDEETDVCVQFLEQHAGNAAEFAGGTAEFTVFPASGEASSGSGSALPWMRARENLIHVLFSHNDFVTIR